MRVRVAAVQFPLRPVPDFATYATWVRTYLMVAHDYGARIACFPEYVTAPLLTVPGTTGEGPPDWDRWTGPYRALFSQLSMETGMYILGGTHLTREGDRHHNTAHLFTPDGGVLTQPKLHLTPTEVNPWNLATGETIQVFETPLGRLAVPVCYDVEFPEAVRAAADAGADILLCPASVDDPSGYWRVRYSCHARAVENQVYVVLAPLIGEMPGVRYLEQGYGRAAIISPCDLPFPPAGVVAEAATDQGLALVADVDLSLLREVRREGSVTPRLNRKPQYTAVVVPAGVPLAADPAVGHA